MKKVKINSLLILLAVVGFVSCEKEDDLYPQLGDDPRNLSEIFSSTPNLSSFYGAMGEVEMNIDSILRQTTTYTVFAPQDAAFSSVESEVTQNLVLNHMIST